MNGVKPLEEYTPTHRVQSATSDRVFTVRRVDGQLTCECDFVRFNPKLRCRHILQVLNEELTNRLDIATVGYVNAALEGFERIMAKMEFFRKPESKYLGALALSLAANNPDGTVTADDIYAAVGGEEGFDGDPRILGAVIARLKLSGLATHVGYVASVRNNARPITKLHITQKGVDIAAEAEA